MVMRSWYLKSSVGLLYGESVMNDEVHRVAYSDVRIDQPDLRESLTVCGRHDEDAPNL
jgi:hypothetical protein